MQKATNKLCMRVQCMYKREGEKLDQHMLVKLICRHRGKTQPVCYQIDGQAKKLKGQKVHVGKTVIGIEFVIMIVFHTDFHTTHSHSHSLYLPIYTPCSKNNHIKLFKLPVWPALNAQTNSFRILNTSHLFVLNCELTT